MILPTTAYLTVHGTSVIMPSPRPYCRVLKKGKQTQTCGHSFLQRCCIHIATIMIEGRIAVAPVVKITAFQSTCNAVLVVHKQRNLFGTINILLIHRPRVLRDVGAVVEFEGWYRKRTIRQGMGRQPTTNGLQDVPRPIKSSNSSAQFLVRRSS